MLKITIQSSSSSMNVVKVEGKLLEPWIAELEQSVEDQIDSSGRVQLDLSGLNYADLCGTHALQDLIRRGAIVVAASGFITTLLGRVE